MYITQKCIRKLLHRYKARSWGNNCPFDLNLLINIKDKYFFGKYYDQVDMRLYLQDQIIYFKFQYFPTFDHTFSH